MIPRRYVIGGICVAFGLFLLVGHLVWGRRYETRVRFYDDGTTQAVYRVTWYLNQWVRSGPFTEYFPDGRVHRRGRWYYERLMRTLRTYDEDGGWTREFYRFGSRFGPAREYYYDGTLRAEMRYENDVLHGAYTRFHPDGTTNVSGRFDFYVDERGRTDWYHSVSNDVWRIWDETGVLVSETVWSNGVMEASE